MVSERSGPVIIDGVLMGKHDYLCKAIGNLKEYYFEVRHTTVI